MATKNSRLSQLTGDATYTQIVFNKVWGRAEAYRSTHSQAHIYMMAFGDTTQPLSPTVTQELVKSAHRLGHSKTYTGYEDIVGSAALRQAICDRYYWNNLQVELESNDIFISDGAQSASVNVQDLFALENTVAVQDPAYPSFVEGTMLAGRPLVYLPCSEDSHFFPPLPQQPVDLIYLCFPNNPTGAVATRQQLQAFVDYARATKTVIVFDAVYSPFITNPVIPRSIYEIEGAKECAIEIGSFSKWAGFTGLRVGWCVIPKSLTIQDTVAGELNELWRIRHAIKFWGTSNVAQAGAIAALSEAGQQECEAVVDYYLQNARLLQHGLEDIGLECFGSQNSPFVWVKAPDTLSSWDFFQALLESTGIVGVPGCVFGSCGEGFLRLNTLGQRKEIEMAVASLPQFIV
ncbi:MAG: LL-diaminopimelate aminotransferase [Cyanobacteria bacterium P01_F01_bin.150]